MRLCIRMKRAMLPRLLLLAIVAGAAACASKGASGTSSSPSRSPRLITAAEIQAVGVVSAYQAIARLRPLWLQRRATLNSNPREGIVVAYVDGVRVGGPEQLERVQASSVTEIAYLNGPDATTRFGMGHSGGAILVRTR